MKLAEKAFDCIGCQGEIIIDLATCRTDQRVTCPDCGKFFKIDMDAEFENGQWRDLTSLIEL